MLNHSPASVYSICVLRALKALMALNSMTRRKSAVIIRCLPSLGTEIYTYMYAIFRPQGRKSTAKFRYFPSALLLFYPPKHYTPHFSCYPKINLFFTLDSWMHDKFINVSMRLCQKYIWLTPIQPTYPAQKN